MNYSEITPYIKQLADLTDRSNHIVSDMYATYDVKRGLRDINGNGVVAGLTEVSCIKAKETDQDGRVVPCRGQLYYRGINVRDLVQGFSEEGRFGFEETVFLLLFSKLPNREELTAFSEQLAAYRSLPPSFVRDMILKAPGKDMMTILSRCVLALYAYDENPDDISTANVLRQCLQLISEFPLLAVYGYHSFRHYHHNDSLFIHHPKKELNTAENLLYILREDGKYTPLEAKLLDLALVLHAEHGGGNNSTFTTHVVSSSGTDTYSAISAALGSLKGPRHGGANLKVVEMFDCIKANVRNPKDDGELSDFLLKILRKEAGDGSGLIYGMGHAVYTKSDPRAMLLKEFAREQAYEKGYGDDFDLLESIERLTPGIFCEFKGLNQEMCCNVDLYSGLVYRMLGIPTEMYTPLFTIARATGWCAHRMEEYMTAGKIIRPAYKCISKPREFKAPADRG